MRVVDLEQGYFMVKFSLESDYCRALTGGPWTISDHYLVVRKWTSSFRITEKLPPSLVVWVRFPAMPIQYYHTRILTAIGNMLGKLIRINYNTQTAQRGKFARIAIELDVSQPLTPDFYLDGAVQLIEYENLPQVCFSCGRIGHVQEECADNQPPANVHSTAALSTTALLTPPSLQQAPAAETHTSTETVRTEEAFGPWMVVQRRNRRYNRNAQPATPMKNQSTKENRTTTIGNSADRPIPPGGDGSQRRHPPTTTAQQQFMEGMGIHSRAHASIKATIPTVTLKHQLPTGESIIQRNQIGFKAAAHVDKFGKPNRQTKGKGEDTSITTPATLNVEGILGPSPHKATTSSPFINALHQPKNNPANNKDSSASSPNPMPSTLVSDETQNITTISGPNGTTIHVISVQPIEEDKMKSPSISSRSKSKKIAEQHQRYWLMFDSVGVQTPRSING
ncbi:unnamed protein product [Linum tenue]|uniref:CCHC-type domain-containing protein n=1 Tax=Linum tenue TaxID=586396 RepID=A0AAV0H622_9ROSI|nr:unnamed protein product [Linum tenue]